MNNNTDFKYKSIFISDVHIGMKGNKVSGLIHFLKDNPSENIFIVGDFFDGWELKNKWHWEPDYSLLIQKLLRRLRKGTNIVYIIGNHDEFMEHFIENGFPGIHICNEYHYNDILLLHGHQFDGWLLQNAKWLQKIGNHAYNTLLSINIWINKIRNKFNLPKWSLSKAIKFKVKSAVSYMNNYEILVTDYARKNGFNKVITGHIHHPCIKEISGVTYYNTGDWVENMSCIAETYDGELKLIELH